MSSPCQTRSSLYLFFVFPTYPSSRMPGNYVHHGDLTLALTRCSCSALREIAVFVRECGKCKPLYASVIERCVTLPVGTWSVACKQSFRFVGGHVHTVTTSHFERKETKFVSNKTAFTVEIALLFVFSLSNSLFFVSFLRLSDLSHTQEQAGSMP